MIHKRKKVSYQLNEDGAFVIENYDLAKPFSSFFPGVAGIYGIPLWVFYVNRGQCIASFGSKNKDGAILEFFPANKAYQNTSLKGFRTFLKIKKGSSLFFYEPFQNNISNTEYDVERKMIINSADLRLEEMNHSLGIKVQVHYFSIPEEFFGGLARIVTVTNVSKRPVSFELLDGAPLVIPFGATNWLLKNISRTIEAWMQVKQLDKKNAAVYKLKVHVSDKPEVTTIEEGNFYACFLQQKQAQLVEPIVESEYIFGPLTDFTYPYEFFKNATFKFPKKQITDNKTPGAFSYVRCSLGSQKEKKICSVFGYTNNLHHFDRSLNRITSKGYLEKKETRNTAIIDEVTSKMFTASGLKNFDLYCEQTFLDNVLRGGFPLILNHSQIRAFHIYWRKHGDLERDYNHFVVNPTYFSEGNGNYRDINQNRRNDVWFNPEVKDTNILVFFSLIQPDGFNPLVFSGVRFTVRNAAKARAMLRKMVDRKAVDELVKIIRKPFVPGEVFAHLENHAIRLRVSREEFIQRIIAIANTEIIANHNDSVDHVEGFWTDHWTYNSDCLESYLSIYPEKLSDILLQKKIFLFYDNSTRVVPRDERYVLKNNKVRQFHAVAFDTKKKLSIDKRTKEKHWVRTKFGEGVVYRTNLSVKILCLLCNKIASLDPCGIGVEMEADKPNWYDALNGLPGLFGSSLNETLELKRLAILLQSYIVQLKLADTYTILVFEELATFFKQLHSLITNSIESSESNKDFVYWDKSNSVKESYRKKTHAGFSGKERPLTIKEINSFLSAIIHKIDCGVVKARGYTRNKSIPLTYFMSTVTKYKIIQERDRHGVKKKKINQFGLPCIAPLAFSQRALPLFLEGPVHMLKLESDKRKALALHTAIRKSPLFDTKLKMYKVNASLKNESEEIGRTKVFTPGWLENESIWLHMEYKYLLEVLRKGLYKEFFNDFRTCLVPFQDPQVYGRSTIENSSFIVSSSNLDKKLHGNGFVARLSGSTAEFLHIWLLMAIGEKPFFLNSKKEINLQFRPSLPRWLFTTKKAEHQYYKDGKKLKVVLEKDCFGFMFLGTTVVVYHNPQRRDTFGRTSATRQRIVLRIKQKNVEIASHTIPALYAEKIRNGEVDRIDIFLS
ncbi:hypothetical protein ACFL38_04180 [Candidatus Omnitrophota bacterium]